MSLKSTVRAALTESRKTAFKDAVHNSLTQHGFDGNSRFESHSAGIAKLHDVLNHHGLTIIDHVQAPVGNTASGHHTLQLGYLHPEGKEDPKPADAHVHVQWTNLTHHSDDVGPHGDMPTKNPPRFEFLAYVPGKLPTPAEAKPLVKESFDVPHYEGKRRVAITTFGKRLNGASGDQGTITGEYTHAELKDFHANGVKKNADYPTNLHRYAFQAGQGPGGKHVHFAGLGESAAANEGIFDTPFHSTHYAKIAKHLTTFLDKHAEGYDKENATPAMRDAQHASFVLKNPQSSGYSTAVSGAHDVIQAHFATPDRPEGRPGMKLMSAARIYLDGAKGKTLDHHIDHMNKLLGESSPTHLATADDGDRFAGSEEACKAFAAEDPKKRKWSVTPIGSDAASAQADRDDDRADRADRRAARERVTPPSQKDYVAANKFRITGEAVDGGNFELKLHSPDGTHIGGVHRGQMFLKRGAMQHREGAAKAWREYKDKTGQDGQGATFDGLLEATATVAVGQGAQGLHHTTLKRIHALATKHGGKHTGFGPKGIHFGFKDSGHAENFRDDVGMATRGAVRTGHVQEHVSIDKVKVADPDTKRVLEWRVVRGGADYLMVEHPDTHHVVSFRHADILG